MKTRARKLLPLVTVLCLAVVPSRPAVAQVPEGTIHFSRFMKDPDGYQYDMFSVTPEESRVRRLTRTTSLWEGGAKFSPDGSQIVYIREKRKEWIRLMIADPDTENARVLAEGAFNGIEWSPDGNYVSYETAEGSNMQLYVVEVATGDKTLLDEDDYIHYDLDWSPDSKTIVYGKNLPPENNRHNSDIYSVSVDGGEPTRLTDAPGFDDSPEFSPDGSKIVFQSTRDDRYSGPESDGPYSSDLFLMNPDGSDQEALTRTPSTWDEDPKWSPDGDWILYHRGYDDDLRTGTDSDIDLLMIKPDGSDKRALTDDKRKDEWDAVWSPDSRWVVYETEDKDTKTDIHLVNRAGRNHRVLVETRRQEYVSDWG